MMRNHQKPILNQPNNSVDFIVETGDNDQVVKNTAGKDQGNWSLISSNGSFIVDDIN